MTETKGKYGSFQVTMRDIEGKNPQTYTVNPLSQKELASGWELVVPKKQRVYKTITNEDGSTKTVKSTNESFFKVNLSQLPNSLWNKIRIKYYKDSQQRRANNNSYVYIITETPFDNEIRELHQLITMHNDGDIINLNRVRELCETLESNEINGWVLLRGRQLLV